MFPRPSFSTELVLQKLLELNEASIKKKKTFFFLFFFFTFTTCTLCQNAFETNLTLSYMSHCLSCCMYHDVFKH